MSVKAPDATYRSDADAMRYGDDERGWGWIGFAAVILGLLGTVNFIEGIAAIGKSSFFVGNAHYVFGDLNTWGWVVMLIGIAQGLTAIGIAAKNQFARWTGVAMASLNALAQLLFIPAYPFWSLSLFALDVLVLYGLIAYGGRIDRSA
jgi:hypothetical protein